MLVCGRQNQEASKLPCKSARQNNFYNTSLPSVENTFSTIGQCLSPSDLLDSIQYLSSEDIKTNINNDGLQSFIDIKRHGSNQQNPTQHSSDTEIRNVTERCNRLANGAQGLCYIDHETRDLSPYEVYNTTSNIFCSDPLNTHLNLLREFTKTRTNYGTLVPKVIDLFRILRTAISRDFPIPVMYNPEELFKETTLSDLEAASPDNLLNGLLVLTTGPKTLRSGGGGKCYFMGRSQNLIGCQKAELSRYISEGSFASPVLLKNLVFAFVMQPNAAVEIVRDPRAKSSNPKRLLEYYTELIQKEEENMISRLVRVWSIEVHRETPYDAGFPHYTILWIKTVDMEASINKWRRLSRKSRKHPVATLHDTDDTNNVSINFEINSRITNALAETVATDISRTTCESGSSASESMFYAYNTQASLEKRVMQGLQTNHTSLSIPLRSNVLSLERSDLSIKQPCDTSLSLENQQNKMSDNDFQEHLCGRQLSTNEWISRCGSQLTVDSDFKNSDSPPFNDLQDQLFLYSSTGFPDHQIQTTKVSDNQWAKNICGSFIPSTISGRTAIQSFQPYDAYHCFTNRNTADYGINGCNADNSTSSYNVYTHGHPEQAGDYRYIHHVQDTPFVCGQTEPQQGLKILTNVRGIEGRNSQLPTSSYELNTNYNNNNNCQVFNMDGLTTVTHQYENVNCSRYNTTSSNLQKNDKLSQRPANSACETIGHKQEDQSVPKSLETDNNNNGNSNIVSIDMGMNFDRKRATFTAANNSDYVLSLSDKSKYISNATRHIPSNRTPNQKGSSKRTRLLSNDNPNEPFICKDVDATNTFHCIDTSGGQGRYAWSSENTSVDSIGEPNYISAVNPPFGITNCKNEAEPPFPCGELTHCYLEVPDGVPLCSVPR